MTNPLTTLPTEASTWEQALYAFLVEKGNRSGSRRTVKSYGGMLWRFFADTTPDRVRPADVLAYAHGVGLSGRPPAPVTIGARIACLSSYFRFLIRMGLVNSNPCDLVERPRTSPSPARGYSAAEVRRLLDVVPDTSIGRLDRAILLVFLLTGRRRTEVMTMTAGDIEIEEGRVSYRYRGKGGKQGRRELPRPAWEAIRRTLDDCGKELAAMRPERARGGYVVLSAGSAARTPTITAAIRAVARSTSCRRATGSPGSASSRGSPIWSRGPSAARARTPSSSRGPRSTERSTRRPTGTMTGRAPEASHATPGRPMAWSSSRGEVRPGIGPSS